MAAIDEKLQKGWSTEKVYINLTKEETDTLSETLKNPKIINNRKYKLNNKTIKPPKQENEVECIVKYLKKEGSFVKSFHLDHWEYSTVNFTPEQLWDIYRFCVRNNGIFCIDTTFEICDGLYLTYTTNPNLFLHDINGKNPEFPGPLFWHFKRTRETYRPFAGELLIHKPLLINLHKIGHDLDKGLAKGINF